MVLSVRIKPRYKTIQLFARAQLLNIDSGFLSQSLTYFMIGGTYLLKIGKDRTISRSERFSHAGSYAAEWLSRWNYPLVVFYQDLVSGSLVVIIIIIIIIYSLSRCVLQYITYKRKYKFSVIFMQTESRKHVSLIAVHMECSLL